MGTGQIGAGGCLVWGRKGAIILDLCRKAFQSWWTNRLYPGRAGPRARAPVPRSGEQRARGTVAMSPRHGAVATVLRWRIGTGRWRHAWCDSRHVSYRVGGRREWIGMDGLGAAACGWSASRVVGLASPGRADGGRQGGRRVLGRRLVRAYRPEEGATVTVACRVLDGS